MDRLIIRQLLNRLAEIETSVEGWLHEGDLKERIERMRQFSPKTDLRDLTDLTPKTVQTTGVNAALALAPFFLGVLRFEQRAWDGAEQWWLAEIVALGEHFPLSLGERVHCPGLIPRLEPDQVVKQRAAKVLNRLNLAFPPLPDDAMAYLISPHAEQAFVLISDTPALWNEDLIRHAQHLLRAEFGA